jgi:O-glycosyl hydrolase
MIEVFPTFSGGEQEEKLGSGPDVTVKVQLKEQTITQYKALDEKVWHGSNDAGEGPDYF